MRVILTSDNSFITIIWMPEKLDDNIIMNAYKYLSWVLLLERTIGYFNERMYNRISTTNVLYFH